MKFFESAAGVLFVAIVVSVALSRFWKIMRDDYTEKQKHAPHRDEFFRWDILKNLSDDWYRISTLLWRFLTIVLVIVLFVSIFVPDVAEFSRNLSYQIFNQETFLTCIR